MVSCCAGGRRVLSESVHWEHLEPHSCFTHSSYRTLNGANQHLLQEMKEARTIEFVGAGSYRYLAGVNRNWRQFYDYVFPGDRNTHHTHPIATSLTFLLFFLKDHSKEGRPRSFFTEHLTRAGDLQSMMWAHASGHMRLSEYTTWRFAAENGHLRMLQWSFAKPRMDNFAS